MSTVIIDFLRDGHTDSISILRNRQRAGSITFNEAEGEWSVAAHSGYERDGRIHAAIGMMVSMVSESRQDVWAGKKFDSLLGAMQYVIDTDPKATKRDIGPEAHILSAAFRKYTRFKLAR